MCPGVIWNETASSLGGMTSGAPGRELEGPGRGVVTAVDGGATGWLTGGCSGVEYVSGAVGVGEVAGSRGSIDGWFVVVVDDDEPDEDKSTTSPLSPNPQQTSRKRRTVNMTHQQPSASPLPPIGTLGSPLRMLCLGNCRAFKSAVITSWSRTHPDLPALCFTRLPRAGT